VSHKEGFALMTYTCEDCKKVETLWNSRDGVTPFCISCTGCKGHKMYHDNWKGDIYDPEFGNHLKLGLFPSMRVFVDASSVPRLMKKKATDYVNLHWENPDLPMKNSLTNEHGAALSKGQAIDLFVTEWTKDGGPAILTAEEYVRGD
jgi:hypothetical protein